jgi:hypothetical protein
MGSRRKAYNQQTGGRISETAEGLRPIFHSCIALRRILGHTLSPPDKPWTLFAGEDSCSELLKIHDLVSVTTKNARGESQSQHGFHGNRGANPVAGIAPEI